MKRFQSVLCTLGLGLSLSSTVLAGTTTNQTANGGGILISDLNANGILVSDVFTWDNMSDILVSSFGYILAS